MTEAKRGEAGARPPEGWPGWADFLVDGLAVVDPCPDLELDRLRNYARAELAALRARRASLEARVARLGRIYEALCEVAQLMADENDVDDVIGLASLRGILAEARAALEEEDGG